MLPIVCMWYILLVLRWVLETGGFNLLCTFIQLEFGSTRVALCWEQKKNVFGSYLNKVEVLHANEGPIRGRRALRINKMFV